MNVEHTPSGSPAEPILVGTFLQEGPIEGDYVCFLSEPEKPRIKRTNNNIQLVPRSDHDWLKNNCVNAVRLFASALIDHAREMVQAEGKGEEALRKLEERKTGDETTCSHFIEVADLSVNLGNYLHKDIPAEVIAFTAYAHDLVEDFKKFDPSLTNEKIVRDCWTKQGGDPAWAGFIVEVLDLLTDNPNLHGQERLDDQVRIANTTNPDGSIPLVIRLVSLVRYCDKLATGNRDCTNLIKGLMPFGSREAFVCHYKKREKLIMRLDHVPTRLKRWYKRLITNKIEPALKNFSPAKTGTDGKPIPHTGNHIYNDFLAPINFVMRSTTEHGRVTRQMLARPTLGG